MIYFCCDRRRRNRVALHPTLNGIDYLEVLDREAPEGSLRQQTLLVRCLKPVPLGFDRDKVRIEGGDRIRDVAVDWACPAAAIPPELLASGQVSPAEQAFLTALSHPEQVLAVRTDSAGDYSTYLLSLQVSPAQPDPPASFDPRLAAVEFSFKVECPSDFDCKPSRECPPQPVREPEIDYLAKDYASFRRLMLDRMATLAPWWQERSPLDLGVVLVELLAYVGDHLSYQQDAVASEAYLNTARSRISVRRHARLVDYRIGEGANARTWLQLEVGADISPAVPSDPPVLPAGTRVLTRVPEQPVVVDADPEILRRAELIFETVEPIRELRVLHNRMPFYTWGDDECCLPRGTTEATLEGHYPQLLVGQVLILEEVLGPLSGHPGDADPTRRHAVRLTFVDFEDGGAPLRDPLTGDEITHIAWHRDDALPFALCLSARRDARHGGQLLEEVSVARGNVVLADHGLSIEEELAEVPQPTLRLPEQPSDDRCHPSPGDMVPPRFRPCLAEAPLTHAVAYDPDAPAGAALQVRRADAVPAIVLAGTDLSGTTIWMVQRDLLASDEASPDFVVEIESDGRARLRFGDDQHGRRPTAGTRFSATYRVGNGPAGNLGADALSHIVSPLQDIVRVRNPIPAWGGSEPESIEQVRRSAPYAFRRQERAVTPADYAVKAGLLDEVQKAAATFRWTGSWHTVFTTIDPLGGGEVDAELEAAVRRHLERFRMAGHDLEVDGPRYVPLEIELQVCVHDDYFRSDVRAELERVLSNRDLPDGRRGVFHPDAFSFGQTVWLSPVYAAAQAVPGVRSLQLTTFQQQGVPDQEPLQSGKLELERLQIARLDNDPNYPERGVLRLHLVGGK